MEPLAGWVVESSSLDLAVLNGGAQCGDETARRGNAGPAFVIWPAACFASRFCIPGPPTPGSLHWLVTG